MVEKVILGAGIAGISAAYHANKYGYKTTIYEARDSWGGLLDNFFIDRFRFDTTVHLSFAKDKYVRSIFDQTDYYEYIPVPYNYENGVWLKHPVQNNLYPISASEKVEAIKGFIERPNLDKVSNYYEWLLRQYGGYIADRYPVKYTQKYWTVHPKELSVDWVGIRMYRPNIDEVLIGALTDETPNLYYAKEMRYPQKGGFKAFLNPMVDFCDIKTKKRAIRINPKHKYVEFADGEKVYYETLISSIPLPNLVSMIDEVPLNIIEAAKKLWATSVAIVSIGFNRPDVAKHLWFYVYDESILASRVYSPNLKSPDNVPDDCSSLQFEIYFSKHRPLKIQCDNLIEHIANSIEKMDLASKNDIIVTDCRIVPFGNVVFDHGMISRREAVKKFLKTINIHTIGRFGEWAYLWSDQSLLSGKRVIDGLFNKGVK